MVMPTIWGMIVDARDHVRTIVFWPERWIASTLCISLASTNGPFFVGRDKAYPLLLSAPAHDVLVRVLAAAGAIPQGRFAPGRLGPGHADARLALAAAAGGIARRQGRAPPLGAPPQAARPAGASQLHLAVLQVAHL